MVNVYLRNNILKLNKFYCSDYAEIEESESISGDILQLRFTYIRLRFELVFYLAVTG